MQNHYFNLYHPLKPYTHTLSAIEGTLPPSNATRDKEPQVVQGTWPCWNGDKGDWLQVEDHRKREDLPDLVARFGTDYPQNGTEYWLPEDTHGTPARTMKEVGPLPDGWSDTPPPPTIEELFDRLRSFRDAKLTSTDKYLLLDYPISQEYVAEVKTYRQALRDLPVQPGAPWDGGGEQTPWPELPKT